MRRKDRAITAQADMLAVLEGCEVLRVGFNGDAGRPYIVPMHFAYVLSEENSGLLFYFHSAKAGRKLDLLAADPRVCFEADRLLATVPAETPCQWSARYESVMGEGYMEVVTTESEKILALNLIMKRYGYPLDKDATPPYQANALAATAALKLTVTDMTGKHAQ